MELDNLMVGRAEDGHRPEVMSVVSELTRRCLSVEAERSHTPKEVVKILRNLFARRGERPTFIRSYNGPEFEAHGVKEWRGARGADTLYIEPGSMWESAYTGTFVERFADEPLER